MKQFNTTWSSKRPSAINLSWRLCTRVRWEFVYRGLKGTSTEDESCRENVAYVQIFPLFFLLFFFFFFFFFPFLIWVVALLILMLQKYLFASEVSFCIGIEYLKVAVMLIRSLPTKSRKRFTCYLLYTSDTSRPCSSRHRQAQLPDLKWQRSRPYLRDLQTSVKNKNKNKNPTNYTMNRLGEKTQHYNISLFLLVPSYSYGP